MTAVLEFETEEIPDSIPPVSDVDHPCETCGRETGWSGRGRRKKQCDDCKPTTRKSSGVRVTGNTSTMAAQAAKVLSNANSMMALGAGGFGFIRTMKAILEGNDDFEKAAYTALLTDPALCRKILSVGQASAGLGLFMGYLALGMGVAPVAAQEFRDKRAAQLIEME